MQFFYKLAKIKNTTKSISYLRIGEIMSIYKQDIVNHIVNHFTNIFSTSIPLSQDMDLVDAMIHSLIDDNKTNMFSMIPSTL